MSDRYSAVPEMHTPVPCRRCRQRDASDGGLCEECQKKEEALWRSLPTTKDAPPVDMDEFL